MSNSAQLIARGKELAQRLSTIEADETMSRTDKSTALDVIAKEFEDHQTDVNNSERAQEFRKQLGEGGGADAKTADGAPLPQLVCGNLKSMGRGVAAAALRHPVYKQAVDAMNGTGSQFDKKFEISVKDATEANNLMGEGLYGTSSPTGLANSSALFLPGAFGAGVPPMFIPGVVEQRLYELTLADLFTSMPVDVPVVTYLRQSAVNWEANATAEGAVYPFSSTQFDRVQDEVGKVSNAATVTDETVRDAPMLFSFLQGELVQGVERQEEVQLLAGPGYPGVSGLLSLASSFTKGQSGITGTNVQFGGATGAGMQPITVSSLGYGRQALGTGTTGTPPSALTIAETIFEAMIDIQTSIFFSPNGIVMNPKDFATIRLAKDGNNQYYGGSMFGSNYGYTANAGNGYLGNPGNLLWNTRVVQTPTIPQGTILVGYFGPEVAKVLRREGVSLQMTNANGTDFVNGKITLRAEERVGLMVTRPLAFQLIQLANA